MTLRNAVFLVPLLALMTTTKAAHADSAPSAETSSADRPPSEGTIAPQTYFGAKGTLALGIDFDMGAGNTGIGSRPLGIGVRPTLDAFVLDGFSVGGSVGFEYTSFSGNDIYNYGGATRLGYALRLNDRLALWPKAIVSFDVGGAPAAAGMATLEDVRVGLNVPLVFTLGGHVMFELGPVASTDVWRTVAGQQAARMDILGLRTGLVGWF